MQPMRSLFKFICAVIVTLTMSPSLSLAFQSAFYYHAVRLNFNAVFKDVATSRPVSVLLMGTDLDDSKQMTRSEQRKPSKRKRLKEYIKKMAKRLFTIRQQATQTTQSLTADNERTSPRLTAKDESSEREIATDETPLTGPIAIPANGSQSLFGSSTKEDASLSRSSSNKAPLRTATTSKVDLSGQWIVVASDEFKAEYEKYLTLLGQPSVIRTFALSLVEFTTEEVIQSDGGASLIIQGRNLRREWGRTLIASSSKDPVVQTIVTADGEHVTAENWWENGTLHRSWIRGGTKFGGGDFENVRYIQDGFLICDTTFHPNQPDREQAKITWKFRKN